MDNKTTIGIRMPNWIGDAVMATPVLKYVKNIFPDSFVIVITKEWTFPIFKNNPYIDDFFLLPDNISKKISLFFSYANKLKKKRLDYYFSLPNSFGSALFGYLASAKKRIGYANEFRSIFLTDIVPASGYVHRTDKYLDLFYYLKKQDFSSKLEIFPDKDFTENLKKIFDDYDLYNGFIGINPNSMAKSRRWFPERFAELIKYLSGKNNKVVIFGSKKDVPLVNKINSMASNSAINLAGKINLSELIQTINYCKLFITNDSGPMHIAFALDIPTIDIVGAADVKVTGNYNKSRKTVYINKNVICSPCVLNKCPNKGDDYLKCMKEISVNDVISVIEDILK